MTSYPWNEDERERLFWEELLPLMQELVRNACVNTGAVDSAQEERSAQTLKRYLWRVGLSCRLYEPRPGRVSLAADLPGRGKRILGLMGHTDVVPARAEDWSVPPFSALVQDGELWGRGTVDMLCWTASQAVALAAHARSGRTPPWTLRYLALADEEASGNWGAKYLTENHWEEVRCDAMVTELGGFSVEGPRGRSVFYTLAEKGVCWAKLRWKGKAGHGSMPTAADNALIKAARAALTLATWEGPEDSSLLYQEMREAIQGEQPLAELQPGLAAFLHSGGHTSISPNGLSSGEKINIIPDRAELLVDVRFLEQDLTSSTPSGVEALLKRILGPQLCRDLTIDILEFHPPTSSPMEGPVPEAIRRLIAHYHPSVRALPCRISGVTDGRFWRARGVPVYGFTLFDEDMTLETYTQRIHAADERISLKSLRRCLDFFLDLPEQLPE